MQAEAILFVKAACTSKSIIKPTIQNHKFRKVYNHGNQLGCTTNCFPALTNAVNIYTIGINLKQLNSIN